MGKQRLLLNWHYHRTDITETILKFSEDFDLIFINDYNRITDEPFSETHKVIYWNDYSTPYALLKSIKPNKIIFFDIESFHQVALLTVAKKLNIHTFVLEHGLRGEYEIDAELNRFKQSKDQWKQLQNDKNLILSQNDAPDQSKKTLYFYFSALAKSSFKNWLWLICFAYIRKKYGLTYGLYKIRKSFRWADNYLNFTETNSSYIRKRDAVPLNRFIFSGNPAFDSFFHKAQNFVKSSETKYLLLLDAPFVETPLFGMSLEDKNKFISKLNKYALENNYYLYIKLHPISYFTEGYHQDSNIKYFRKYDLTDLILNSEGCIHIHFASLSPLALYYKPYMFFNFFPDYNVPIIRLGIRQYSPTDKSFDMTSVSDQQKESLLNDYIFSTDGKAYERIRKAIL